MPLQVIHVRVNDSETGKPTPARIRFTGPDGTYFAPLGRSSRFPTGWNEQVGGQVCLNGTPWAYIDGTCEIRLPPGPIAVEASKGIEYTPVHQTWERKPGQISLRLSITRKYSPQSNGWYAGDTQVYFLPPHAGCLEGAAEGLHVVNMLAAEWGHSSRHAPRDGAHHAERDGYDVVSNLLEFSGQGPALDRNGCLVVVNTQNRHQALGAVSLLNCHRVIYPLAFVGDEFGDWSVADWCDQCHRKGGLVVWPSFPPPSPRPSPSKGEGGIGLELPADLVLGKIDALEWTATSDFDAGGLEQWYRWLNAGFRVPLVGGSGKTNNAIEVGAVRTYARLEAGQAFSYAAWIDAIRKGRTFVTRGPLVQLTVNGHGPGEELPSSLLDIQAQAESLFHFERLEVVCNGEVIGCSQATDLSASLSLRHNAEQPCWLAARCFGRGRVLAHTSPIYVGAPGVIKDSAAELIEVELDRLSAWLEKGDVITSPSQHAHLLAIFSSARELLRLKKGKEGKG